eukprot:scaffold30752_cov90-Isochrysis_galbana.AAC.1
MALTPCSSFASSSVCQPAAAGRPSSIVPLETHGGVSPREAEPPPPSGSFWIDGQLGQRHDPPRDCDPVGLGAVPHVGLPVGGPPAVEELVAARRAQLRRALEPGRPHLGGRRRAAGRLVRFGAPRAECRQDGDCVGRDEAEPPTEEAHEGGQHPRHGRARGGRRAEAEVGQADLRHRGVQHGGHGGRRVAAARRHVRCRVLGRQAEGETAGQERGRGDRACGQAGGRAHQ